MSSDATTAEMSTNQSLHRTHGWVVKKGTLKQRGTSKMIILGGLDIISNDLGIHEAPNGKNNKQKGKLMRDEWIIGGIICIKNRIDLLIEVLLAYGIVPRKSGRHPSVSQMLSHTSKHLDGSRVGRAPLLSGLQEDSRSFLGVEYYQYLLTGARLEREGMRHLVPRWQGRV